MNYINYLTIKPPMHSYTMETNLKTDKTDPAIFQSSAKTNTAIYALTANALDYTPATNTSKKLYQKQSRVGELY